MNPNVIAISSRSSWWRNLPPTITRSDILLLLQFKDCVSCPQTKGVTSFFNSPPSRNFSTFEKAFNTKASQFTYTLPKKNIALYPLVDRDSSKLLVAAFNPNYDSSHVSAQGNPLDPSTLPQSVTDQLTITHENFFNIAHYIPPKSLLIFNQSKVIAARLKGTLASSKKTVEIFLLHPEPNKDPSLALRETVRHRPVWRCLIKGKSNVVGEGATVIVTSADYVKSFVHQTIDQRNIKPSGLLRCSIVQRFSTGDGLVRFDWDESLGNNFGRVLSNVGFTPLPPYIKRDVTRHDRQTYQTVYARDKGSVAAPTAGLHFTNRVLEALENKNVQCHNVTLHVGAGTFRSVASSTMAGHVMHDERIHVHIDVIRAVLLQLRLLEKEAAHDRVNHHLASRPGIVSVGTTSVRTLESLYWVAAKLLLFHENQHNNNSTLPLPNGERSRDDKHPTGSSSSSDTPETVICSIHVDDLKDGNSRLVGQWEPYLLQDHFGANLPSPVAAFETLIQWMDKNNLQDISGQTQIIIVPGYKFKIINALITNFHEPNSTLLMLVSAFLNDQPHSVQEMENESPDRTEQFLGKTNLTREKNDADNSNVGGKIHQIYQEALAADYRFLSYGDSSFLVPTPYLDVEMRKKMGI